MKSSLRKFYSRHPWLTVLEYLCHKWPLICSTCRNHFPVLSSFMTYFRVCNWINTTGTTSGAGTAYLPEHLSSPPVFSGVRVSWSLVLCVSFVEHCFSFSTFSFGHCFLCSSIYGFWLPLWYLQTLLKCYFWGYWCFTPPCTFYNISDISWRLALFTGWIQSLSAHT